MHKTQSRGSPTTLSAAHGLRDRYVITASRAGEHAELLQIRERISVVQLPRSEINPLQAQPICVKATTERPRTAFERPRAFFFSHSRVARGRYINARIVCARYDYVVSSVHHQINILSIANLRLSWIFLWNSIPTEFQLPANSRYKSNIFC